MWWFVFIISIASILACRKMAQERARSFRIWLWIAAFAGPLAPLVLLILGDAEHPARANQETPKINRMSVVGKEAEA